MFILSCLVYRDNSNTYTVPDRFSRENLERLLIIPRSRADLDPRVRALLYEPSEFQNVHGGTGDFFSQYVEFNHLRCVVRPQRSILSCLRRLLTLQVGFEVGQRGHFAPHRLRNDWVHDSG